MDAYTISKLASEAGVSVHILRDYVVRGLLHAAQRTNGGYGIYDAQALGRLLHSRQVSACMS
jgi:MerR family mercuric resistance operon transcriptional regulator